VSKFHGFSEWDLLAEVIVGIPDNATIPYLTEEVKTITLPKYWKFYAEHAGEYFPSEHVAKAVEEMDEFCRIMQGEGVAVRRPDPIDFSRTNRTQDFEVSGMYAAMPRDILITIGSQIIEAPMAWRSRWFEGRAYKRLLDEYRERGATIVTAPKPMMTDDLYVSGYTDKFNSIKDRHQNVALSEFVTTESEICFDAADFMRAGRDIFCQRSQVTNLRGIKWMRDLLEKVDFDNLFTFTKMNV